MMTLLIILVTAFIVANAKHEQYSGWKSFYVGPTSGDNLVNLEKILEKFNVETLSRPNTVREGLVLVEPEYLQDFINALEGEEIPLTIHSNDIKESLEAEDVLFAERKMESFKKNGGKHLPYDSYQEWPENNPGSAYATEPETLQRWLFCLGLIDSYMVDIATKYPEFVELVTPAHSFEGRPIRYLKISSTNFKDSSKPVIFIDGGIHAREWISPPTVTWAIHELVENNTDIDLLHNFDWILLPVVNPDGYQFSHTDNRFWRKTRSTDQSLLSEICPGVDGNRNYDFFWNTVGTSESACGDTYAGSKPFSEIETRVVRNIIDEYLPRMIMYLTMHSYGSMILYPWGHDGSLSNNAFALHTVGISMAQTIDSMKLPHFPSYIVGNGVLVLGYPASGASEDYAHMVGVPLSYTYELPGLLPGFSGFHLDPKYIQQVCIETWAGIAAGARRARDLLN